MRLKLYVVADEESSSGRGFTPDDPKAGGELSFVDTASTPDFTADRYPIGSVLDADCRLDRAAGRLVLERVLAVLEPGSDSIASRAKSWILRRRWAQARRAIAGAGTDAALAEPELLRLRIEAALGEGDHTAARADLARLLRRTSEAREVIEALALFPERVELAGDVSAWLAVHPGVATRELLDLIPAARLSDAAIASSPLALFERSEARVLAGDLDGAEADVRRLFALPAATWEPPCAWRNLPEARRDALAGEMMQWLESRNANPAQGFARDAYDMLPPPRWSDRALRARIAADAGIDWAKTRLFGAIVAEARRRFRGAQRDELEELLRQLDAMDLAQPWLAALLTVTPFEHRPRPPYHLGGSAPELSPADGAAIAVVLAASVADRAPAGDRRAVTRILELARGALDGAPLPVETLSSALEGTVSGNRPVLGCAWQASIAARSAGGDDAEGVDEAARAVIDWLPSILAGPELRDRCIAIDREILRRGARRAMALQSPPAIREVLWRSPAGAKPDRWLIELEDGRFAALVGEKLVIGTRRETEKRLGIS